MDEKKQQLSTPGQGYACGMLPDFPTEPSPSWCCQSYELSEVEFKHLFIPNLGTLSSNVLYIITEPFSFSWVLAEIATGILSKIGEETATRFFDLKNDPKVIIQRIVLEFSQILGQKIEEQTDIISLRDGNAKLNLAKLNLANFVNSRDNGRTEEALNLLNETIQNLREAISYYLEISHYQGSGSYMIAAGLELSCLIELNKIKPENEYYKERAKFLVEEAINIIPEICGKQKSRFSQIEAEGDAPDTISFYYIDKDKDYQQYYSFSELAGGVNAAVEHRCNQMVTLLKDSELTKINPMYEQIASWERLYRNPNLPSPPPQ